MEGPRDSLPPAGRRALTSISGRTPHFRGALAVGILSGPLSGSLSASVQSWSVPCCSGHRAGTLRGGGDVILLPTLLSGVRPLCGEHGEEQGGEQRGQHRGPTLLSPFPCPRAAPAPPSPRWGSLGPDHPAGFEGGIWARQRQRRRLGGLGTAGVPRSCYMVACPQVPAGLYLWGWKGPPPCPLQSLLQTAARVTPGK